MFTPDGQAAVIMGNRTFRGLPAAQGQTGVVMKIQPLDPATLGALPPGKQASGNAYRVTATFQPSGASIDQFGADVTITLIYPPVASAGVTPPPRTIMWSKDGTDLGAPPDAGLARRPAGRGLDQGHRVLRRRDAAAARDLHDDVARATAGHHHPGRAGLFVLAGVLYIVRTRRREKAGA